jgi:hypothetical protein
MRNTRKYFTRSTAILELLSETLKFLLLLIKKPISVVNENADILARQKYYALWAIILIAMMPIILYLCTLEITAIIHFILLLTVLYFIILVISDFYGKIAIFLLAMSFSLIVCIILNITFSSINNVEVNGTNYYTSDDIHEIAQELNIKIDTNDLDYLKESSKTLKSFCKNTETETCVIEIDDFKKFYPTWVKMLNAQNNIISDIDKGLSAKVDFYKKSSIISINTNRNTITSKKVLNSNFDIPERFINLEHYKFMMCFIFNIVTAFVIAMFFAFMAIVFEKKEYLRN